MIERDVENARIGQFVLVKGSLIVADLKMLQDVWKSDVVRNYVKSTIPADDDDEQAVNRGQRRAQQSQKGKNAAPAVPTEADLVMELLPYLPHSSQLHLVTDDYSVWGTVDEPSMVGSVADLTLKHGAKIAGEWSMLGILDGLPFQSSDSMTGMEMLRSGMTTETISKVPLTLAPFVRQLLGRPLLAYAMTPLILFRAVAT